MSLVRAITTAPYRASAAVLTVALLFAGCDQSPVSPGSNADSRPDVISRSTSDGGPPSQLVELGTHLAGALETPQVRRGLATALERSPVHENKLFVARHLKSSENGLLAAMARAGHLSRQEIVGLLDELPPLEMYFPVPEHRETWAARNVPAVAVSWGERNVASVAPDGTVASLSPDRPPEEPTLVITGAEGFDADGAPRSRSLKPDHLPFRIQTSEEIQPDTDPGDGSSTCEYCFPDDATWQRDVGIREWMKYVQFTDDKEPWHKGDPEFYLLMSGSSDLDSDDDLHKRIEFPSSIWDGVDAFEYTGFQTNLITWDVDWGTRVKVQCFESDADLGEFFTVSGSTDRIDVGQTVEFQGEFSIGDGALGDDDDNCGSDYITARTSTGSWLVIPDGPNRPGPEFDGTSILRWFGFGEDLTG